jgi:sialic acid synthase SpsE
MSGPDHAASLEPAEFADMVLAIRRVEASLGSARKQPCAPEIANRSVVRKSIVAARPIRQGQVIGVEDLAAKRCGGGLSPTLWDQVVGSVATRDYDTDEPVGVFIDVDRGAIRESS